MGFKVVLNPYKDPAEGLDWDEQTPLLKKEIAAQLSNYHDGKIDFSLAESVQGLGVDMPTLVLEVLAVGSTLFFGIPALHKKIREALEEWKIIKERVDKFFSWLNRSDEIVSYSIEVAFLKALDHLQPRTEVSELTTIEVREILGKSDSLKPEFSNTPLVYYLFIFREADEQLHIVIMDCHLRLHVDKTLSLDPRFEIQEPE